LIPPPLELLFTALRYQVSFSFPTFFWFDAPFLRHAPSPETSEPCFAPLPLPFELLFPGFSSLKPYTFSYASNTLLGYQTSTKILVFRILSSYFFVRLWIYHTRASASSPSGRGFSFLFSLGSLDQALSTPGPFCSPENDFAANSLRSVLRRSLGSQSTPSKVLRLLRESPAPSIKTQHCSR